ncbi:SlyX family protein [Lentisphaera profundi]|uniref:SlyX family protein n=1 Tax=Lentisphaera profundi TaxID=1658616 RepID=A0ABY7VVS6_9BACT|nr:SlyX family protein [Lentisphaera profundi]WDE97388.1 SlyX family protein [Lentisphaera profundi]
MNTIDPELNQRLIRLETLSSMQDDLIETLNEVITNQQMEIQEIQHELKLMKDNVEQDPIDMNQRPPHY